jgi:capsular polysaccharide biosynthesis protein
MEDLYLNDIVNYYFKKLWIIVLITIVFIVGGLTYSFKIKTPMYKSTTSVILASGQTITQSDLTLYQKLINTYTQIAKSRNVLNNTISNLNLTYNYNQLKDNVTVSAVSDTEIINISVVDKSPTLAKKIADSIANNFKDEVASIYNLTNISILDESVVAQTPYNYNILKDTIIYVALGLFIGFVYVFLRYYFDRNIKSKEEVE